MNCLLALQKCPIKNEYSIHGLWFDRNCKKSCLFSTEKLSSKVIQRLRNVWYSCPSISKATSPNFWKHEYCKHGKQYFATAEAYFKAALQAYDYVKEYITQFATKEIRIPLIYHKEKGYFTHQPELKW